ncbi:MAG: ATP-binding protein [Planctomycetaceae bacterium]|nr:ATP-binding protein [Planctomycetaceae bacterium]
MKKLDAYDQEQSVSRAEYDELQQRLKSVETEKNKIARELKLLKRRNEFYTGSVESQNRVNKLLSDKKERQEMYVRLLLETSPNISFVLDENMLFLLGTKATTSIINTDDVSRLYGQKLDDIIARYHPPALSEKVLALIRETVSIRGGGGIENQMEVSAENKKYEVTVLPFHNAAHEFVGVLVVMIDNTEILNARDIAEAGTKAKSEFLARMSHEIRTPMNAILGITYLCLQTELFPKQRDYLGKIQTAAKNLLGIIDDLLDFSKIEAGKLKIEQLPFLVTEVIGDVTALVEQKANEKGIQLVVQSQNINDLLLLGDSLRLRQILTNLLNNAVKFTESGSAVVAISPTSVEPDFVTLHFSVKDTGIGITPDQMQKLFQSFSQADNSMTRRYGGTGLGLAITKNLIELMGGTIMVESVPQQGTTFSFQLRFPKARLSTLSEQSAPEANPEANAAQRHHLKGSHVLLVEDNKINQIVASEMLQLLGIEVTVVDNGQKAVDAIKQQDFDLVLMDIQMPVMDGHTATRAIRLLDKQGVNELPIIAMTANAMDIDFKLSHEAGMNSHLSKPIDPEKFRLVLETWILSRPLRSHDTADGEHKISGPIYCRNCCEISVERLVHGHWVCENCNTSYSNAEMLEVSC